MRLLPLLWVWIFLGLKQVSIPVTTKNSKTMDAHQNPPACSLNIICMLSIVSNAKVALFIPQPTAKVRD